MLMRKINAALSLLTALLLLDHAIFHAVRMLSRGAVENGGAFMSWILFGLMLLHAVISIDLAISARSETESRNGRSYPRWNLATMVQRFSGLALIVLAGLHVAGAAGFMAPPPMVRAVVSAVFFTVALAHVAVSTAKAFITLGIGNARFIKAVDLVIKAVCAATLIAAILGVCLYKV